MKKVYGRLKVLLLPGLVACSRASALVATVSCSDFALLLAVVVAGNDEETPEYCSCSKELVVL